MSKIFTTYVIHDPRDGVPVYVGQTVDFERRKREHLAAGMKAADKRPRGRTIKAFLGELHALGREPIIVPVATCENEGSSIVSERLWVSRLCQAGFGRRLLNQWPSHRRLIDWHLRRKVF
jgi:hypothetical protein